MSVTVYSIFLLLSFLLLSFRKRLIRISFPYVRIIGSVDYGGTTLLFRHNDDWLLIVRECQ